MKPTLRPSWISPLVRATAVAVTALSISAVPAAAQMCPAEYVGSRCGLEVGAEGSTIRLGEIGSSSRVFVTILGASARNGSELFWVPSADATMDQYVSIAPPKPNGVVEWDAGDPVANRFELPGTFAGGSEVLFATRILSGEFYYSGSLATRNPGAGAQFNMFGEDATVYRDNRVTPIANTPPGAGSMVVGFEDRATAPGVDNRTDRDYNDLVFAVAAETSVVPEPVSMALLGTGLLGIAGVRLRRRRGPRA